MTDLIKSVLRGPGRRWPTVSAMGAAGVVVAVVGTFYAGAPAEAARALETGAASNAMEQAGEAAELATLSARVAGVREGLAELGDYYDDQVAPVERVLLRYRKDAVLARHVAVALVREANRAGLQPRLLLAVLLVENPWLDPEIRSPVGAIGLMQVMPVHRGAWGCGSNLEDIDSNICHGARIFAHYFEESNGDVDRALLRYNGCVQGTNTPTCRQYPTFVFARAGRASLQAWLGAHPSAAAP